MSKDFLLPGAGPWASRTRDVIRDKAGLPRPPESMARKPNGISLADIERICVRGTGERLMHLRVSAQLTMDEVASRTGVSKSEISRLETGKRKITDRHVAALAPAYGISEIGLRYVLGYSPSLKPLSPPAAGPARAPDA